MAEITLELDFTPRPRARRTSGPPAHVESPRPFDLERTSELPDAHAVIPGRGVAGRRTVTIQGRPAERYRSTVQRRRPTRRPYERDGFRPDRVAMWAVMLGFVLVLVAATSSHAATVAHRVADAHARVVRIDHRAQVHTSARPLDFRAR